MTRFPKLIATALASATTLFFVVLSVLVFDDYVRLDDFLRLRLALNASNSEGFVFNPDEHNLTTLTPLPALIDALLLAPINFFTTPVTTLAAWLVLNITTALALGLAATQLYVILGWHNGRYLAIAGVLVLVLSQPVWFNMRSGAGLAVFWVLLALRVGEQGRWGIAGALAGLGTISSPAGIAGAVALGGYAARAENGLRFWRWVWVPLAAWIGFAALYFDGDLLHGLLAQQVVTTGDTAQNILWIGIFVGLAAALTRHRAPAWLWMVGLWTIIELATKLLIYGELTQVDSLALAVFTAAAVVVLAAEWQRLLVWGALPPLLLLLVVFPLQTLDTLQTDLELSESIHVDQANDLLHDRSHAITLYLDEFTGNSYAWDGDRSPLVQGFRERNDYTGLVIRAAPDFIYINNDTLAAAGLDLRSDLLRGLDYRREIDVQLDPGQREGDGFWYRDSAVVPFGETVTVDQRLTPDIVLQSYATDHQRVLPGEPFRLRLDWQLDRSPEDSIGLQVNLLDTTGIPLASLFPRYDAVTWATNTFSTYHVFNIAADTLPQPVRLNVAIDYKAAIIGRATFAETSIRPVLVSVPETPVGQIASVTFHDTTITPFEGQLNIRVLWETNAPLTQDYQVLMHLVPVGDVQPVATGDAPPLNGNYPTSAWQPGDVISDTYRIPLADVPPGDYLLNTGFYLLDTFERLRDDNGDSLTIARITITKDGGVSVLSPAP